MCSLFNKVVSRPDSSFMGPEIYKIWVTWFGKIYKIINKNQVERLMLFN